jgi:hypothetical protein
MLRTCVLKRFFAKYSTGTVPHGILQCTIRYRYCFMVRANASIPHVMRIIVFTILFLILLQLSLACIVALGWPRSVLGRCSAAARISRPAYHSCPYPASNRPSSTHISLFSLTTCTSDYIFSLVRCAYHYLVSVVAVKRSLPLLPVQNSISNKCVATQTND